MLNTLQPTGQPPAEKGRAPVSLAPRLQSPGLQGKLREGECPTQAPAQTCLAVGPFFGKLDKEARAAPQNAPKAF